MLYTSSRVLRLLQSCKMCMDIEVRLFPGCPMRNLRGTKPDFGAHGNEETPVPISNTEVKLVSGDYTATSGKLARCRIIKSSSE